MSKFMEKQVDQRNWKDKNSQRYKSLEERFWEKVNVDDTDDCWEWQASLDKDGYGNFRIDKKQDKAHRASYILNIGNIPDGMLVCHTCDNPACVNPHHLFLGTHKDNMNDMVQKNRSIRGRKLNKRPSMQGENHHRSKLTKEDVLLIRKEYSTGKYNQYELADKFNVAQSTIWRIINHLIWKHI